MMNTGITMRYAKIGRVTILKFYATNSDAASMIDAPSEMFFQQQQTQIMYKSPTTKATIIPAIVNL